MHSRSWRHGLVITAVIALVALGVTACGGDDATAHQAQPASTVTVTAPATTSATATDAPATPTPTEAGADAPPTTYAEAQARIAAAQDVSAGGANEVSRFVTPSGNIYCLVDAPDVYAGCEIEQGKVDDPSACPGQQQTTMVGRIEIHGDKPVAICNTDTIVEGGTPPVLAYGSSAMSRDVACVSEQIGVTCISRGAPVGFFLARGHYALITH